MDKKLFSGASTALITPFNDDGSVNYKKFEELLDLQLKSDMSAVIVCGTTAETPTLTDDEKNELIRIAVDKCKNKIQVVVGTGCNDTRKSFKMTENATKLGADSVLVITPYYNKTSQKGLYEHYKFISEATDKPIIVYNVPSRTGMTINLETYVKLQEINNIKGIKEASGDLSLLAALIDCCGKRFNYYCGNDDIILPFLSLGGDGIISVIGNLIPKETSELCNAYFMGNISRSAELQIKYTPLINALFAEVSPMPIKYAMNKMNFSVGKCRLPLTDITQDTANRIDRELEILS